MPSPTAAFGVGDATAGSSATTSTADPPLTNGSLSVKKVVAFCENISTIKPETPTKEIYESMTQVDGTATNGSLGGGGGPENGTGIKKKRKNKSKNKTIITSDTSADDQVDLKQKEQQLPQQLPPEKEPKKKEKKKKGEKKGSIVVQQSPPVKLPEKEEEIEEKKVKLSNVVHKPDLTMDQMNQEVSEDLETRKLTIISELTALKDNITDVHEEALSRNVSGVDATGSGATLPIDYIDVKADLPLDQEVLEDIEASQSKLTAIKDNMTDLHEEALTRNVSGVSGVDVTDPGAIDCIDVVVNADPRRPPYSLLLFRKILKDSNGAGIRIKTHVDSSLTTTLPAYLKVFNIDEDEVEDAKEALTIHLIWKNTTDLQTELIVKPFHQKPIAGEGNLARYFSRILPMTFPLNYDTLDSTMLIKVDQLLEDAREKDVNFEGIEEHLKASGGPFLLGQMTIADLVVFSRVTTALVSDTVPNINWEAFEGMLKRAHLGPFLLGEMTSEDLLFFSKLATALVRNYGRFLKYPLTREWIGKCQIYGQFQLF